MSKKTQTWTLDVTYPADLYRRSGLELDQQIREIAEEYGAEETGSGVGLIADAPWNERDIGFDFDGTKAEAEKVATAIRAVNKQVKVRVEEFEEDEDWDA